MVQLRNVITNVVNEHKKRIIKREKTVAVYFDSKPFSIWKDLIKTMQNITVILYLSWKVNSLSYKV